MKILSVDTSTPVCTVGVVKGDLVLAQAVDSSGQTHAQHLMGMIHDSMADAGISMQEIDGFAVVTGPGTFTGLRIGISTIKGLAFALSKPVAGVTSLAALAAQADLPTKFVCPVMDARRNEVYYGMYTADQGQLTLIGKHRVAPLSDLVADVRASCQFIGGGARLYRETIEAALGPLSHFSEACWDTIHAKTIARLALKQFHENKASHLDAVSPYYIRRSDAELHAGSPKPSPPPLS